MGAASRVFNPFRLLGSIPLLLLRENKEDSGPLWGPFVPPPQRHSKIFKPCCRKTLKCIIEILKLRQISNFLLQIPFKKTNKPTKKNLAS